MKAKDFRAQARWALKGKWRRMIALMLLTQAVQDGFGLPTLYSYLCAGRVSSMLSVLSREEIMKSPMIVLTTWLRAMRSVGLGWLISILNLLLLLLGSVIIIGRYRAANAVLDDQLPTVRQILPLKLVGKAIWANLLRALIFLLTELPAIALVLLCFSVEKWSAWLIFAVYLLCLVPPVLVYYQYGMTDFVLAERPELSAVQAMKESRRHMRGNRFRFFALTISFLGWVLLAVLTLNILSGVLSEMANWLEIVYLLISWLCCSALNAYTYTAQAAFFRNLAHGEAAGVCPEAQEESFEQAQWDEKPEDTDRSAAADEVSAESSDMDINAAKAMFLRYRCSRKLLREAGEIEKYDGFGVDTYAEQSWIRDYAQQLMMRFSGGELLLDDLLSLAGEYAMDDLVNRVLERIDRHIRQNTLPEEEILNMLGRVLAVLVSGAFAGSEGFVERKKAQIADMADRLEELIEDSGREGDWRDTLKRIREMCRE